VGLTEETGIEPILRTMHLENMNFSPFFYIRARAEIVLSNILHGTAQTSYALAEPSRIPVERTSIR